MKKIVVSASSMVAGRNMSSQIEYLQRVTNYGADMYHLASLKRREKSLPSRARRLIA